MMFAPTESIAAEESALESRSSLLRYDARRTPLVVCVDDDPATLAALRRALRREPCRVLTSNSPDEALAWLAWFVVDLVVADERMPVLCGRDFLRLAAQHRPYARRILLTAYPDVALFEECQKLGARLVMKPWADRDLRETLRSILRGGSHDDAP